ncbi:MAG: bifunctional methylenetetrahydrofolate dehydrogenase/methenyltetrahydrofolate cyclohydrolase [Pseudomonas fluorescens]|nr:MAG: bifunctional methylenetetrahydrofolate dehydrogenase/methenyltetrahydrofolate cyclohydrolase [Pseudomonas fluorescens]
MNQPTVTPRITTRIVPGGPLRDALLVQITNVVKGFGVPIRICIVQVGDNPASNAYIRHKVNACAKTGIQADIIHLHEDEGEHALHATLRQLANDDRICGIIVQTPLPSGWHVQRILDMVPPSKDIDGLSTASAALRTSNAAHALLPATPLGILRLMTYMGLKAQGARIAVIGKGMVVGAPLRALLEDNGATVVAIDKDTPSPARLTRECDIVVAAAGAPGLVNEGWVKLGATVIDVGITRVDGKLLGDVARAEIDGIAGMITPVPGGVGPMTVASLLTNIVDAACLQVGRPRTAWVIDALPQA